MEALNRLIAQLRDLFASMTPGARVTAALLLAAVVVSLGYLFIGGSSGGGDYLFNGEELPSSEVNAISAALAAAGIEADTGGNRIRVPVHQKNDAMAAIATAGALPANMHSIVERALNAGSVFEGGRKQMLRVQIAIQDQLSAWVRAMDWVKNAHVRYSEEKPSGLRKPKLRSASVNVMPVPGEVVTPQRAKMLKGMVASNFAGLKQDQVVVTDLAGGGEAVSGDALDLAEMSDDEYFKRKIYYQEYYRKKIAEHLVDIPGVRVAVHAALKQERMSTTVSTTPAGNGTPTHNESTVEKETTTSKPRPQGSPGVTSQGPGAQAQTTAAVETSQTTSSLEKDSSDSIVGVTRESIEKVGLTPTEVKTSIRVPMEWVVDIWKKQWERENPEADPNTRPAPTPQELDDVFAAETTKIENNVRNLIVSVPAGQDTTPFVQVTTYESPTVEPLLEPTFADNALAWAAGNWTTVGMFLLVLVALWMLRSMVKSMPAPSESQAAPALQLETGTSDTETSSDKDDGRPRLRLNKGPDLKEDLAAIVREDPDAAAAILRAWIGNAA